MRPEAHLISLRVQGSYIEQTDNHIAELTVSESRRCCCCC